MLISMKKVFKITNLKVVTDSKVKYSSPKINEITRSFEYPVAKKSSEQKIAAIRQKEFIKLFTNFNKASLSFCRDAVSFKL